MPDTFENYAASLESPAQHGFAITPHDSVPLTTATRAIYVGTAGNIAAVLISGAEVTFSNVPSGSLLPVRLARVKSTGTTASNMLGLL